MSVESRTHPSDLSAFERYGVDRVVRHQRCRINLVRECGIIVMLLVIVSTSKLVSCAANDFEHCESTVLKWAASSSDNGSKEDRLTLKDLLFFLHVPRTGGRTYFYCFLKKLYPTSQECPRSYDKLRFDPSKPNCRLVVTHDDYSLMSKLPKERTSVVTILRNPVDRVFSTYEFSVEVAARFLVHPNLTSVSKMSLRLRSSKKRGVSTLDIWPWKYLVPWMVEDLFGRRATRKYRLDLLDIDKDGDTYNMEDFVMPLNDFINNPMAHDLIHNGATFQVAGLTNNSCLAESNKIRLCVREHPSLSRHVLDVAKKRLDDMLYVGLTEDHKQSATMFANMVGAQVLSQLETLSLRTDDESTNSTGSKPYSSINLQNRTDNREATEVSAPENVEQANGNMTVAKLMEAYDVCVSNTRKSQATRRINSLKQISPVNFSKEARLQVPETLLQQIQSLNSLDMELYKHAQDIFRQQGQPLNQKFAEVESQTNLGSNVLWFSPWKALMMVTILFLFLYIFIVNKRRRTSKIKI